MQEGMVIKGRLALEQTKEKCREETTTKFNRELKPDMICTQPHSYPKYVLSISILKENKPVESEILT